jgi:hypothetical protein
VDTVASWLKFNSTPPFRVDSRQTGSCHALPVRGINVAAAKQFTSGTRRALSSTLYCVKIPPRRNCDAGGQNATGQSNQECQEAFVQTFGNSDGRTEDLMIYRKRVIGTVCQYPDADSARKSVTGLLREISPNPLQRSSLRAAPA